MDKIRNEYIWETQLLKGFGANRGRRNEEVMKKTLSGSDLQGTKRQ